MAANLLATSPETLGPADDDPHALSQATLDRVVEAVEFIVKKLQGSEPGAQAVRRLLEADGDAEVDFALQLARWHITGRFDKLVRRDGGFEIVDWKTDAGDSPAEIVKRYRPQMQLYALALYCAGKHVLVEGSLRVHLALLHFPRVETMLFSVEELEEHAHQLARELSAMDAYEPARKAAW
jgi:ATP-dependent exoDNAse (exonuclease V) beta subunit